MLALTRARSVPSPAFGSNAVVTAFPLSVTFLEISASPTERHSVNANGLLVSLHDGESSW